MSVGCGLPPGVQLHDWSLSTVSGFVASAPHERELRSLLRIEQFRHRVSLALAVNALDPSGLTSTQERLSLYRVLNAIFGDLEREIMSSSPSRKFNRAHTYLTCILTNDLATSRFYLSAARLHLHAFYLFDEPSIDGYTDRIATLYRTAASLIEESLDMDAQTNFFQHCPFFCYQMFVCASFVVLKITRTKSFDSLLDIGAAKKLLNSAISALRKISVANNDLPARLSDVIGFFCSVPSVRVSPDLQLRVRNRLSMSIVYDSLWEWRNHFQTSQGSTINGNMNTTGECPGASEHPERLLTTT